MTESLRLGVFYKFLKDNGAYEKYLTEIEAQQDRLIYSFDSAIKSYDYNKVMNVFRWSETTDGVTFWANLSIKWSAKFK